MAKFYNEKNNRLLEAGGKINSKMILPLVIVIIIAVGGIGFFLITGGVPTSPPQTTSATTTTLTRNPRANVTGYVRDEAGNPISGATVHLGGMAGLLTTTDATGYYEFEVAREERDFEIIVEKEGYNTEIDTIHVSINPVQKDFILTRAGREPVTVKFTLTVPYDQAESEFSIKVDGDGPFPMQRVNEVTWAYLKNATSGDSLSYSYLKNGSPTGVGGSITVVKSKRIYESRNMPDWPNAEEMNYQKVFDFIPYINNGLAPDLELGQGFFDLWGINYNKIGFENTSDAAGPSMERMKEKMNVSWVLITDFAEYTALDPLMEIRFMGTGLRPVNTITQEEMNRFVQKAHSLGMKVIVNIGTVWTEDVDVSLANRSKVRTREWLDVAWERWTDLMVEEAEKCQAAGVDALQVRPRGDMWNEGDDFAYTSEKIRELVDKVRLVYNGEVTIGLIDILDVNEPSSLEFLTMWDAADFIYVDLTGLHITDSDRPTIAEMQVVFEEALTKRIEPAAKAYGKKVMLHVQFQSYVGAIRMKWVEPSDVHPDLIRDWQQQADAYEALLRALEGKNYINCLMSVGYWWDDAMDPFNANNSPSISHSVRGKLAEAVLGKWFVK
ncbi:MAG: carboxypeptidase regulatory-like domain-containing protein [Candidatus Hadarchaeum sp.]